MNQLEEADDLVTKVGFFYPDYEKAICIYTKVLNYVSDQEKIFIYQKLVFCYQKLNCTYDVANCYHQMAILSEKLDFMEADSLYKQAIVMFFSIDVTIAANCCIELANYYVKKNKNREASEWYQTAASCYYKNNIYSYYYFMMKSADLLPESEAIECYEKIILFCEEDLKHCMNEVWLKIYICKKILNQSFEMSKDFLYSKEYLILKNKTPSNEWLKTKFQNPVFQE